MDTITKSYLDEFSKVFGYEDQPLPIVYERFSNYCVVSKHLTNETFTDVSQEAVSDTCYLDEHFDGLALIMNGHLVVSKSGIDDLLQNGEGVEIEIVIIETKTKVNNVDVATSFCRRLWNLFRVVFENRSIDSFEQTPHDEDNIISYLYSRSSILSSCGYPELHVYLVADDISSELNDQVRESLRLSLVELEEKSIFSSATVNVWNNRELIKAYDRSKYRENVTIQPIDIMPFPKISTIKDGYVSFVPFSEFKKLIIDENGAILSNVFHDNIRAYQGENVVNQAMKESIENGPIEEFVLMNNGITVVASDITYMSKELTLKDYQIVNGCQTCHVLYNSRNVAGIDDLVLMVRIIGSKDPRVRNAIILGTNSQTVVRREQLMALSELQENIEKYYKAISKPEQLYYERRSKQYLSETSVPQYKVITIPIQIMAFVSMFIGEPHNVTGYYSLIVDNLERNNKKVFSEDYYIGAYYTSGLAYYKLSRLLKIGFVPREYSKVKYHLLYAFRLIASEGSNMMPSLEKKESMESYCETLNSILWNDLRCKAYMKKAMTIVDEALERKPETNDGGSKTLTQRILEIARFVMTNDESEVKQTLEEFKTRFLVLLNDPRSSFVVTNGDEKAVVTVSLLIKHSKKEIRILTRNQYQSVLNHEMVVNAFSQFLARGGSLQMLLYDYDEKKITEMPLFRRLAVLKEQGRDLEIRTLERPVTLNYNSQEMCFNMFLFDALNERLELQENPNQGKIWINNSENTLTFQGVFEKYWASSENIVNLMASFNL